MHKPLRDHGPGPCASAPSESWLLTPGPLSTAPQVREAMLRDWGSRDHDFREVTSEILARLLCIAGCSQDEFACVPVQGSGTYAVEAMLGSFVPRDGKALVLVNGAYGKRIVETLRYLGRAASVVETSDCLPVRGAIVAEALASDPSATHVVAVHVETTSGIRNPIEEIAEAVRSARRRLLVDAMSSFGALPAGADDFPWDALAASANKCLEGAPGIGFVIARRTELAEAKGRSHSLSLDLHAQWTNLTKTGQWRFTPPTHVAAAFLEALRRHEAEGGVAARGSRYQGNCEILIEGMGKLGFEPLLPARWRSPVIATFHMPADPAFDFSRFYDGLKERGFTIYPGKLTSADSFRVGCIGNIDAPVMRRFVETAGTVLDELGVRDALPREEARADRAS